jgi:tRNA uridine 5-carboxymethylaminomethyl modification enzyme
MELLGHPELPYERISAVFPWLLDLPPRSADQLRTEALYRGYLPRQNAEIRDYRRDLGVSLSGLAFDEIGGLSTEIREKLLRGQPASLGAAARLQGMTPAALAALSAHIRKQPSSDFT